MQVCNEDDGVGRRMDLEYWTVLFGVPAGLNEFEASVGV